MTPSSACPHCNGVGWFDDCLSGGESYCSCPAGKVFRVAEELGKYDIVPIDDFDKICARVGIDPEDDALVGRLVQIGWEFNPIDKEYIAPDKPGGRWGILSEGGLDL